ncbi:unnamed protein product [Vitrella brassicaformis CCMP3155]|uniref:25S rRNA (uridine-N(3))-methyltransferase BMT5-like domain-containing protein n=2 Tax=Vitrella brassicaformis TaxID=1169539 RepID=A0A0G4H3R5_VITBC|nr:unnamed protein product [Vitrella brassicaformis CCMP3155]|eukprot:CEM38365.1 unnamed protein product [Vitrella brassicaformis CCMP3155]
MYKRVPMMNKLESTADSFVADVQYRRDHKTLFLGDKNITFAVALMRALPSVKLVVGMSCPADKVDGGGVECLEGGGAVVLTSVDHLRLQNHFRSLDRVMLNFPLARDVEPPAHLHEEGKQLPMNLNYRLRLWLPQFFRQAATVLKGGGELHLRLSEKNIDHWWLSDDQHTAGLQLRDRVDFGPALPVYEEHGYESRGEPRRKLSTLVYVKSAPSTTTTSTTSSSEARDKAARESPLRTRKKGDSFDAYAGAADSHGGGGVRGRGRGKPYGAGRGRAERGEKEGESERESDGRPTRGRRRKRTLAMSE